MSPIAMDGRQREAILLLDAALDYAARGWLIIPLNLKLPRTEHAYKDGSRDPVTIRQWWTKWPDAWIGVVCGPQSGLAVLDVDPRNGGDRSLRELVGAHTGLPETICASTAGGGEHYYFAYEDGLERCEIAPGLELKPHGGYVVAPPSARPDGACYTWKLYRDIGLAKMPAWLAQLATEKVVPKSKAALPGTIPAGSRDSALASLAGSMRRRGASHEAILAALREENRRCDPPLDSRDLERIAKSIARYSPGPPVTVSAALGEKVGLSDLGNARRFVSAFGQDVRYCVDRDQWLLWDGVHWSTDTSLEIERLMQRVVLGIYGEIAAAPTEALAKAITGHAKRSENSRAIQSALAVVRSQPELAIASSQLDSDPWLVNCRNCVVNLARNEIMPHDRDLLMSRTCPVDFDASAKHSLWTGFLDRVVPDAEIRQFLQAAAGYSLTGLNSEEVLFFVYGPGASGKSTFTDAMRGVLGDYSATSDFESFLKKNGDGGVRNDIARLNGSRMVFSLEMDEGKRLASALVKRMTGGDHITARFLYQELFEFRAAFKLWLVVNHPPVVSAEDSALWRRILVIPFDQVIPEADRDPDIKLRLREDPEVKQAVLAWLIKGAYAWKCMGKLKVPARVKHEVESYRSDNDVLGEFIEDKCNVDEGLYVEFARLFAALRQWQGENGDKRGWSRKMLSSRIKQRGFKMERTMAAVLCLGLELRQ